jgi:hypothetical protein
LASSVTNLFYETSGITLIPNVVYTFKVTARNSVGSSLFSDPLAVRAAEIPDLPTTLDFIPELTTGYTVVLDWTNGFYDGGSPIIDYRISYTIDDTYTGRRLSTKNYIIYESNITTTKFTVTGLTPGVRYIFVVQSRNLVGYSPYSNPIYVLTGQAPDPPTSLQNDALITSAEQIGINWLAPAQNGGAALIDYRVSCDQGTGSTFNVVAEGLTALNYTFESVVEG